ncbi:MAG: hypothetical protein A2138_20385 [Deltaproteobacteria bacterium RBG_16_71_12]|nr:MAG: hypothetical protein A2138_20385 [Deltaproteobacteria bacterium RBG_16_71_12]
MTVQPLYIVVEGASDVEIAVKLARHVGFEPRPPITTVGSAAMHRRLSEFNRAAASLPWFVLRDLDTHSCAANLVRELLPRPRRLMSLRIAVREMESWVLADREQVAAWLKVPVTKVPNDSDGLPDPKATLINLARQSKVRSLREGLVPEPGLSSTVGKLYPSQIARFVREAWRLDVAVKRSDSCRRAVAALHALKARTSAVAT